MKSITQAWGYWNQRRFQSIERGPRFAEKLLAVRTGLAELRGSASSQGSGPPGSWTALPTHLQAHRLTPPMSPQQAGLPWPPDPTPTPSLGSLFLYSASSFSTAGIHPAWPKADIFTLSTTSVLKKSQIWVQLRLEFSICIWRHLLRTSF